MTRERAACEALSAIESIGADVARMQSAAGARDAKGVSESGAALLARVAELRDAAQALRAPGAERRIDALLAHADNVAASTSRAVEAARAGDWAAALDRLALEVVTMVDGLAVRLRRERSIARGPEAVAADRDAQIAALAAARRASPTAAHAFDASVVLCAYDKIDYTELALSSLLEHTDFSTGKIELILVDNGSSDGTRDLFRAVKGARVVELSRNTGPLGGFAAGVLVARGEYVACVANDVVVTPRWLDQLLACARSDPRIAMVVPACNAISNRQSVPTDYGDDFEAMRRFADAFNRPDPRAWEERCRLMPFAGVFPRTLLDAGLRMDPIYAQGEFIDDDQSALLRRAGYRQIFAKDTFLHHFGSVTLGEAQRQDRSLDRMRAAFREKWGVDAWDSSAPITEIALYLEADPPAAGASVLAIEPMFGETYLDVARALAKAERPLSSADAVMLDERYLPDARAYFREVHRDVPEDGTTLYDLVLFCRELGQIVSGDPMPLLRLAASKLAPGGRLLARVRNAQSAASILRLVRPCLGQEAHDERAALPMLATPVIERELARLGLRTRLLPFSDESVTEAARKVAEVLMILAPDSRRDLPYWLTPSLLLVAERLR